MTTSRKLLATAASALIIGWGVVGVTASAAEAAGKPTWSKNCASLNAKWVHGVGKAKAVDRSSGQRVTTFLRSDRLYRQAMSYNRGLDRDKDGIACEKA